MGIIANAVAISRIGVSLVAAADISIVACVSPNTDAIMNLDRGMSVCMGRRVSTGLSRGLRVDAGEVASSSAASRAPAGMRSLMGMVTHEDVAENVGESFATNCSVHDYAGVSLGISSDVVVSVHATVISE